MLKSELIKRISSQNPHLYDRDIEKVVNAILDEMVELCVAVIELSCEVSERFRPRSAERARDATRALVSSRSQREHFPHSRREKRCARGLIGKPCRQTDSRQPTEGRVGLSWSVPIKQTLAISDPSRRGGGGEIDNLASEPGIPKPLCDTGR